MEILLSVTSKTDGNAWEIKRSLDEGLVVGRGAEEGVLLDGPDLSREHLVLTGESGEVYIADLSSNGTWINGSRLKKSVKTRVRPGEQIEIPGYLLTFKLEEKPEMAGEFAPAPLQLVTPESAALAQPAAERSKLAIMLDPVFGFLGSFTFAEKFFTVVALGGLLLLYAYMGG